MTNQSQKRFAHGGQITRFGQRIEFASGNVFGGQHLIAYRRIDLNKPVGRRLGHNVRRDSTVLHRVLAFRRRAFSGFGHDSKRRGAKLDDVFERRFDDIA